jgi:hypothetical protein
MERRTPRRAVAIAALAVLAALAPAVVPGSASALSSPTPWDGTNPFNCTIQDAGQGTAVPDPGADPYCVQFDKTNQNVTQLGIVDFLLNEPARTAAAVPKCFYFQEDHWRATVNQGDATAIYEWVGHYFFNKATGDGGVWVTDFTVDGQTFDPATLPGFPAQYASDFGPGTGGVITHDDVPADPSCAAQAGQSPTPVYSSPSGPRCVPDAGAVDSRGLGPVTLGARENAIRAALGPPEQVKRGFLHYCVTGGGSLLVGQPGDRSGTFGTGGRAPTVILLTTARGFVLTGGHGRTVTVGASRRAAGRAFAHAPVVAHVGGVRVLRAGRDMIVGEHGGRVVYLGVYDPAAIATKHGLAGFLSRWR